MAENEVTIVVSARDQASGVLGGIDKKAQGLGGTFQKVGQIAAGFLAANVIQGGFQKITGFIGDSVSAASNLEESINAVNQIFDESATKILNWGKQNANSFGLSQRAFNQMATPLGAMLKNAGLSMDDVTNSTIELTTRAADMASVFNTDVEDALAAIQAGLRGEADPLERYGVSLKMSAVQAEALAMTGKELASSLTDQELATARVALIMKQTADVAGDFQNTSAALANSQRIAAARTEELQAQIGEKLVPITQKITELKLKLITVLADKVIPTLEELYEKHWPAISKAINDVADVVAEWWPRIQPIIEFGFQFVKAKVEGFIQLFSGIYDLIASVIGTIDALIHGEWSEAWENFKQIPAAVLDIVIGTIKSTLGNIPSVIANAGLDLVRAMRKLGDDMIDAIWSAIASLPSLFKSMINEAIGFLNYLIQKWNNFDVGISTPFGDFKVGTPDMPTVPRLQTGIPFINEDTLAYLHRGERVVSAAENQGMGTGMAAEGGGIQVVQNIEHFHAGDRSDEAVEDMGFGIVSALRSRGVVV